MAIEKSPIGKKLHAIIKENMDFKSFREKFKLKKGKKYTKQGFIDLFLMKGKRGYSEDLKLISEILEIPYEKLLVIFETPKKPIKATNLPNKEKNPKKKEKVDGLVVKIEAMQKGEPVPKAILFEVPTKKSQMSLAKMKDGKWRLELEEEDLGVFFSTNELTETQKEAFRKSKRVSFVILVE